MEIFQQFEGGYSRDLHFAPTISILKARISISERWTLGLARLMMRVGPCVQPMEEKTQAHCCVNPFSWTAEKSTRTLSSA